MTQNATASGSSTSFGDAETVIIGAVAESASGYAVSGGAANATTAIPYAAFDDFAVADTGQPDPLVSYTTGPGATDGNFGVAGAWTQISTAVKAPSDFATGNGAGTLLYKRAAYAAVGIRVDNMAASETAQFGLVQFGKSTLANHAPPPYDNARTVVVDVQADRVNLAINPKIQIGVNGFTTSNTTNAVDGTIHKYGTQSLKVTATAATGNVRSNLQSVVAFGGKAYIWSTWVYAPAGPVTLDLTKFYLQENSGGVRVMARASDSMGVSLLTIPVGQWTRIWGTATLPADWNADASLVIRPPSVADGSTFDTAHSINYDGFLIERGSVLKDYFDGSSGGVDYMWEAGTVPDASRSYYYANWRVRSPRIASKISRYIPAGMQYRIRYAQPPTNLPKLDRKVGAATKGGLSNFPIGKWRPPGKSITPIFRI